jgi:hypothetical protein
MNYIIRTECIFCKSRKLADMLTKNYSFPIGNYVVASPERDFVFIPYNVQYCDECGTVQTKYIGDLNLIYENNFAGAYGSIRNTMNDLFANFILEISTVQGILEIGAGNGSLSESILEKKTIEYTIVDPSYNGPKERRQILPFFFEDAPIPSTCNTVVMSHVFEHFYDPIQIIKKLQKTQTIEHIYISFPDLEAFIHQNIYHVLNPEHTFYVENQFIIDTFKQYGFDLQKTYSHKNHSIFFHFTRGSLPESPSISKNKSTKKDVELFFKRVFSNIDAVNKSLEKNASSAFVWPCSMHTLFCFSLGLNQEKISCVLDNSPLKIDNYLYGYKYKCISFADTIQSSQKKIILLTGGCYNTEVKEQIEQNKANEVHIL